MIENPKLETKALTTSEVLVDLNKTESSQLAELEQFQEFLGNPERVLGFPIEALFRLDILTKNYPSIFYPSNNTGGKRFRLVELIDPQLPGRPFSEVTGYTISETTQLRDRYPDSIAIATAEVGLAIQAYCFLAVILLRNAGKSIAITPVSKEHGPLTLDQLLERLEESQKQVAQATSEISTVLVGRSSETEKWLVTRGYSDHSLIKLALKLRLHEQIEVPEETTWDEIVIFLDQVEQYELLQNNEQFEVMLSAALLNHESKGFHSVSFLIRRYICTDILRLSAVLPFKEILAALKQRQDARLEELRRREDQAVRKRVQEAALARRKEAKQNAIYRLEQSRGKGNLGERSLLPQPPEGVNVVEWLANQKWYYQRVIDGAAQFDKRWELRRAYPLFSFVYEQEYYEKTLKRAKDLERDQPGIIAFLLRFGVTQVLRNKQTDLIAMYANFGFGQNNQPINPFYLHVSDTHDHNNALLKQDKISSEYRKQGKIKPLFVEFNSPFELYKLITFVISLSPQLPTSVYVRAHGGKGFISYPEHITTQMVGMVSSRFQTLIGSDERVAVVINSCHAADFPPHKQSFASSVADLGVRVFAPEWKSYGIKSAKLDSVGHIVDIKFDALGTEVIESQQATTKANQIADP